MRSSELIRKNYIPWLTLIRLEGMGLSLRGLARQTGLTVRQVRTALKHPAYEEFRRSRLEHRVSLFDGELAQDTEAMLAGLRELIPLTLQVYEDAMRLGLSDDRHIMAALRAADSVNDRVGMLTRQSTEVHELHVSEADLQRARELAQRLKIHTLPERAELIEARASASLPQMPLS